jgi:hypothetical protein
VVSYDVKPLERLVEAGCVVVYIYEARADDARSII